MFDCRMNCCAPCDNTVSLLLLLLLLRASIHRCRGQLETTVGEEKQFNPRLSKDIDTFVNIMENLNLAYPKMIGEYSRG